MVAVVAPDEEECYLLAILDSPDGLDLAEFSWVDPAADDDIYRAWDFQWPWYLCEDMYQVDQGGRALGKALDLDTQVPTPTGMTTMGELRAGDVVFDEQGRPCRVTVAHPVLHDRTCLEVEFSDGATVVADAEHLWLTSDKAARRAASGGSAGRFAELQARRAEALALREAGSTYQQIADELGYADKSGAALAVQQGRRGGRRDVAVPLVRTTEEIARTLKVGAEFNHQVALAEALTLPEADLDVDPWILGFWLGDGTSRTSEITVGEQDAPWVLSEVVRRGYRTIPRKRQSGRAACFRLDFGDVRPRKTEGLQARLRVLGVLSNKHIPDTYLRAGERQRRDLLAGIVDSDGTVNKDGRVEVSLSLETLARQVFQLAASLGERPTWSKGPSYLDGVEMGVRYRVGWQPRVPSASMPRKRVAGRPGPLARSIVAVREVPSRPVRCITVDSPSALYLITDALIPTHNTVSITMRACALPFAHPGSKMLLTAPELNHLRPLTDAIEERLMGSWLMRQMLPDTKGHGMTKQPHWLAKFVNNSQIISRLPNKDGKGVKGQHVLFIELDEAQDYPLAGWIEIVETLNRFQQGAMWRCHGVPKGVRDKFFDMTEGAGDEDRKWTVHRPKAMNRPTWGAEERNEKIIEYQGSRQSVDYKRNIYGEHGDASNSVFVLARLMDCVDTDSGSEYNQDVYTRVQLEFERLPQGPTVTDEIRQQALLSMISIPGSHLSGYSQIVDRREVGAPKGYCAYWGGADIGVTNHPSEFLVFGQRQGTDVLELLLRVNLQRINTDDQKAVIQHIFNFYGPKLKVFALDKTGVGFPIWDQLSRYPEIGNRIRGYNFSEKVPVAFEDRPLERGEKQEDLAIWRNVIEATTDFLRNDYVDAKKIRLPYDREILQEFQGQTYTVIRDTGNPYGQRRLFGGGSFHTLDAAKMVMAGKVLPPILAMLEQQAVRGPVYDVFVGGA